MKTTLHLILFLLAGIAFVGQATAGVTQDCINKCAKRWCSTATVSPTENIPANCPHPHRYWHCVAGNCQQDILFY